MLDFIRNIFKRKATVSIFPTKTGESLDLARNIEKKILSKFDRNEVNIKIFNRYEQNVTQMDFINACSNNDLVIVDVTRCGTDNEVNNYDIVNEMAKNLEHVWIISRNYLPINFYGFDEGGYPSYQNMDLDNYDIEKWIEKKLAQKDKITRSSNEKGYKNYYVAANKAIEQYNKKRREQVNVFISHRTKYEKRDPSFIKKGFKFTVEELVENIKNGVYHNGTSKTAQYLDDGSLVYSTELNTKLRAWQLLSIIEDKYIYHCDEFWIYGSDDYLDSWWTLGEMIMYSYICYKLGQKDKSVQKKIMFYNPLTDEVHEISPLKIDDDIAKKICRLVVNCEPSKMGPESVQEIRKRRDILYGDKKSHDEALLYYVEMLIPLITAMHVEQGKSEQEIQLLLSDPNHIALLTENLKQKFDELKNLISGGEVPEGLKQSLHGFMNMMRINHHENLDEEEIIKTGWSRDFLEDEVFSEDFSETVIYNTHQGKMKDLEVKLEDIISIENQIKSIDKKRIWDCITFKYPAHCIIGNIADLEQGKIKKTPDGKDIIRRNPRYFFIPSIGGVVNTSSTENNLSELSIFTTS